MIVFEFDEVKSQANLAKHGIDFKRARQIWDDPNFVEIEAKSEDEPRWLVIGCINSKYWSAVITYREEKIRIISVRRARAAEVTLYES
jgi:hypothetical protein